MSRVNNPFTVFSLNCVNELVTLPKLSNSGLNFGDQDGFKISHKGASLQLFVDVVSETVDECSDPVSFLAPVDKTCPISPKVIVLRRDLPWRIKAGLSILLIILSLVG
uniref:Uncharacterized protein n=1 Tax=Physcomitrium patens TaxID=3218 RepID=A0A2K1K8J6_PHYPA|nr:hypothetical protein PHYPA_011989 [Physcomitrium patens]